MFIKRISEANMRIKHSYDLNAWLITKRTMNSKSVAEIKMVFFLYIICTKEVFPDFCVF
jgi:hypothetical protein